MSHRERRFLFECMRMGFRCIGVPLIVTLVASIVPTTVKALSCARPKLFYFLD